MSKKWLLIALVLITQHAFAAPQYEYKKIAVGARWKQCGYSRESAIRWAHVSTKNEANRICDDMGNGWRFSHQDFKGYEQAIPCKNAKTFQAEVDKAIYVCKRLVKKP